MRTLGAVLNQLLTPEKVQMALEHMRENFLPERYESAQEDIQRALEIFPHRAGAFTLLGLLELQVGNIRMMFAISSTPSMRIQLRAQHI